MIKTLKTNSYNELIYYTYLNILRIKVYLKLLKFCNSTLHRMYLNICVVQVTN